MSDTIHSHQDDLNKLVTVTIIGHAKITHLCAGCQDDEGRQYVGVHTRKDAPIDVRLIIIAPLPATDNPPMPATPEQGSTMCTDCLKQMQQSGVNVLDANGKTWEPEGFFLREPANPPTHKPTN